MPTVHIFVGQCGNQLGPTFLDVLATEAQSSGDEAYQMLVSDDHFRRHPAPLATPRPCVELASLPQPRCVMVDMEPKVMERAIARVNGRVSDPPSSSLSSSSPPRYWLSPQQCVSRGEGSGNNWAFGYHHQGRSRREALAESLRREAEVCEAGVGLLHVVHSAAGGTGSGVGCLVGEVARELFPRAALTHTVVWPFTHGEVVPQGLNLTLCLATLRELVDGAFLAFNDVLGEDLRRAQGDPASAPATATDGVSFEALNTRIGRLLAPLFLPHGLYEIPRPMRDLGKHRIAESPAAKELRARAGDAPRRLRSAGYADVLEGLCLDPARKFFTGVQLPPERIVGHPSPTTWSSVLLEAARRVDEAFTGPGGFPSSSSFFPSGAPFAMGSRSCVWALRGYDVRREGLRELQDLMASRLPGGFPLTTLLVSPHERNDAAWYARADHEVSLYGHTPVIPRALAEALRKVEDHLRVGAFLHHFERFGVEKATIEEATMKLWDTVAAYDASLVHS
ncbi:unnamed protein product [Phytomonas sp. EM1]|nr:unnamed protein product [Phytomonas sp. EM1]|eukprot:CCW63855.1 unnamed protein product [Phytomonas sp. isolate EM1]